MKNPHLVALFAFLLLSATAQADWKDDIGYARLQSIVGGDLPTTVTNGFTQVEATDGSSYYMPNTASAAYTGKTFLNKSGGPDNTSSHADAVATYYYSTSSLLSGTAPTPVDIYEANNWIGSGFLNEGTTNEPLVETRAIQNHSWIGSTANTDTDTEINRRLDYAINRDGFVCVVGENNGSSNPLPNLLGQSYHTIAVGLSNGSHSHGTTTIDGTGRIKPDIVAPHDTFTSYSTPMVASAAGILYEKLSASPYSLSGADLPRTIKAILMASASKTTVSNWDNTTTRPLDDTFGAGELNIYHAYQLMIAGQKSSGSTQHEQQGWSTETVTANSTKTYFFTIPSGADPTPFCATITWHRIITDNEPAVLWGSLTSSLADLNLKLHNASGTTTGSQITHSSSTVDNVEMIYQSTLPAGEYAIVIENTSLSDDTPFALAWHSLPSVGITATTSQAQEIDGQDGVFTFTRTGDTTYPLYLPISVSGDAIATTHYTALPASLQIPAGQTSTTLNVDPIADNTAQGDRTVTVTIAADFGLISGNSSNVIIKDKPTDEWRFNAFSESELLDTNISGDSADPDLDNIPNLLEYALNLNPKSPNSAPTSPLENGGYLSVSVNKNSTASDLTWSAEVTSDLSTWNPATIITNTQSAFEARDTVLKSSGATRMIRIKVVRQ